MNGLRHTDFRLTFRATWKNPSAFSASTMKNASGRNLGVSFGFWIPCLAHRRQRFEIASISTPMSFLRLQQTQIRVVAVAVPKMSPYQNPADHLNQLNRRPKQDAAHVTNRCRRFRHQDLNRCLHPSAVPPRPTFRCSPLPRSRRALGETPQPAPARSKGIG